MDYNRLSRDARETIRWSGHTIASYVRYSGTRDGEWHGDRCGCTDDRCAGYHHDASDECQCLPALLERMDQAQEAYEVWHAYRAAVEANDGRGDPTAYEAAWARAELHVRRHYPRALTFSLDAVVKDRRGLSITYPGTDPGYLSTIADGDGYRMLVWSEGTDAYGFAERMEVTA